MRYCVIQYDSKYGVFVLAYGVFVLAIDDNSTKIFRLIHRAKKKDVVFYLSPDINTVHKVITEDELDFLLIEEKLRK